jgi:hypothetical protein
MYTSSPKSLVSEHLSSRLVWWYCSDIAETGFR